MSVEFRKMDKGDIEALQNMVASKILVAGQINDDYCHDELGTAYGVPDALVRASSTLEVSNVMQYAYTHDIPVVVRGSGTGLVGGAVAVCGGIMLDVSPMNRILELDEDNLTVTVQCGVLLMELAQFCNDHGYQYCPDPGEKSATIGGNISTNAGGMRAVKYGVTRDAVRALTTVLPTGEVVELGGKVVKNSSGYSLMNLVIGSEGTLAVVTQATLKVVGAFHGLSRERSDARKYPAIHPLDSWSKYNGIIDKARVEQARDILFRSNEINQMMKVVGEEGTSVADYIVYQKGELLDSVYLQQNSFDPVDSAVLPDRQREEVNLLYEVLTADFALDSKKDVRAFFNQMRQKFLDWNSVATTDPRYSQYENEIRDLYASKSNCCEEM